MSDTTPNPLRLERTFDCTPQEMWAAWTVPEQYAKWLNPAPGLDLVIHEWDLREGGRMRFDMPQPDGNLNPQEGVFHVLKPYTEIVSGSPDKSFLLTARFHPEGKRTRLTVEIVGVPPEWHAAATQGWGACLDKLQAHLIKEQVRASGADFGASAQGFTIERTFRAAPEKVWEMWTTPEGILAWWAEAARDMGFDMAVREMDVRVGGRFAFEMARKDLTIVNRGTYRVVEPHSKLAWTWHYDIFLAPGEEPYDVPISVVLEPVSGGTRMTFTQGPLASPEYTEGSRQGVVANFEKLAKALGE